MYNFELKPVRIKRNDNVADGRGQRHFVKSKRWEVKSCPESYLRGTWLEHPTALRMLKDGDFYPQGTVIHVVHEGVIFRVVENGIEILSHPQEWNHEEFAESLHPIIVTKLPSIPLTDYNV